MNKLEIACRFIGNFLSADSRPLPNFIIIGAQKAGTSSLFEYLTSHPDVYGSFIKEVQFFTSRYWIRKRGYRAFFPHVKSGKCRIGEATPYYLFSPEAPRRAAAMIPDAHIVALLREPVSRAYSHYKHNIRRGHEKRSFKEAYLADLQRYEALSNSLKQPDESELEFRHHSYVRRGLYYEQLQRWMEHFPRDRFFIGRAEDFFADPAEVTQRVATFLGLSNTEISTDKAHNQYAYDRKERDEFPELVKFFQEPNIQLAELTGIEW